MSGSPLRDAPNPADRRRSQRLTLQIPIQVRAQFGNDPPIPEDTKTMVVNRDVGLIALAVKVRPGQRLTLRNWASSMEQECRVALVGESHAGKNEVAIKSPYSMPQSWNLAFSPPDSKPFAS
jgi:hypothetical protein